MLYHYQLSIFFLLAHAFHFSWIPDATSKTAIRARFNHTRYPD